MDEMLIWSFAILCIVSAIYWFLIKKKSTNTNNQSQSGSQQSATGKKIKDYAWVLYTVIAVIILIGVWKIAESACSDDVVKFHLSELEHAYGPFHTPARKQATFESLQGVSYYIRNDETDWVLVGPGLPPPHLYEKCGCNSRNLWFKINELDDHDFDIQITYEPVDKKFDAMNLK